MNKPKTQPSGSQPIGSAIDEQDRMPSEREALDAGLALVTAKWGGDSDFDKGMRLLQKAIGIKPNAKLRHGGEKE